MPEGILPQMILVAALVLLLAAAFVVTLRRSRRAGPTVSPRGRAPARDGLGARVRSLIGRPGVTDSEWNVLQEDLIRADAGPAAAAELVTRVRERYRPGSDPAQVLSEEIAGMFQGDPGLNLPQGLAVVMVVGVNGSGKTTTIGKLARRLAGRGRKVALANSDTFRAAAGEQLSTWADRAGAALVSQERGADPGAVAFDAVKAAQARGHDVLIVDTAGRLQSKKPLMDELAKVRRVLEKAAGRPPDEVLLVLDATTGQNGIGQARTFLEAVDVTGIALTKLDGSAKGGIVLAIREELGVPVKLVGTGEGIADLEPFDPKRFADSLVEA